MQRASQLARRSREIISINLDTTDPLIDIDFWDTLLYTAIKPCTIIRVRSKLNFSIDMELNYDKTTIPAGVPWMIGCSCAVAIFRADGSEITQSFLPQIGHNQQFWPYYSRTELMDYFWLHCDSPTPVKTQQFQWSSTTNPVVVTSVGTLGGLIAAPAGTGTVGPLDLAIDSNFQLTGYLENQGCGGTTVSYYNNSENVNIRMNEEDDIRLSGLFSIKNNCNAGGKLSGTIELLIQF
jgi:hypothetical protein